MTEPAYVACPCGFRAEGSPREALTAYRAHECAMHQPEKDGLTWPAVVGWIALLVFLAFVCSVGVGLRS